MSSARNSFGMMTKESYQHVAPFGTLLSRFYLRVLYLKSWVLQAYTHIYRVISYNVKNYKEFAQYCKNKLKKSFCASARNVWGNFQIL